MTIAIVALLNVKGSQTQNPLEAYIFNGELRPLRSHVPIALRKSE